MAQVASHPFHNADLNIRIKSNQISPSRPLSPFSDVVYDNKRGLASPKYAIETTDKGIESQNSLETDSETVWKI